MSATKIKFLSAPEIHDLAPVKVAVVSVFPPFRGGIAQFNERMTEAFEAAGHTVLRVNFSRQYPSLLFPGKSQYTNTPPKREAVAMLDSIGPATLWRTSNYLALQEVDHVVIPYWTGYLAPALRAVAKRTQVPVTALLHNAIPHDAGKIQRYLGRRFMQVPDRFVTLSQSVTDDLKKLRPDAPVNTLFHPVYDHFGEGVDRAKARDAINVPAHKKTLLFFGLIRPYKGLDTLLEAFGRLPDDYHLIIAGEAYEDTAKYEQLTASFSDRLTWHNGFVADEDLPVWFSAADAVVLPYRSATQSGVTAVAYHFRRPVIATNVGALGETILHDETGMLVPPGDPAALATAIETWFSRERNVEESIASWCEQRSWSRFADAFFDDGGL